MQRGRKKTILPVTTLTKVGRSTPFKVSNQENLIASASKHGITADQATRNSISETAAMLPLAPPKTNTAALTPPLKLKTEDQTTPGSLTRTTIKTSRTKSETAREKVEIEGRPTGKQNIRKRIKPIGSAVVRGKNGRYDFEVFSLDADLKDGPAIYVISRRMTDKRGNGHHKFVCIGQAVSILDDVKKHAKGRSVKQHKANVICLLREEDVNIRVKIETDLREAHTIVCNHLDGAE